MILKPSLLLALALGTWTLAQEPASVRLVETTPAHRVIEHVLGTTEVPLNPERIVSLTFFLTDNLLALGGKPVASPRVRLHDLRHLHASVAIKSGVNPKVLADRLGHARASFTLDVYTHLFEEQRASSAVSLLDFLPKEDSSKED